MPKVYNKRRSAPAEYRNPLPGAVLVDRITDWGNSFIIGKQAHARMSSRNLKITP